MRLDQISNDRQLESHLSALTTLETANIPFVFIVQSLREQIIEKVMNHYRHRHRYMKATALMLEMM